MRVCFAPGAEPRAASRSATSKLNTMGASCARNAPRHGIVIAGDINATMRQSSPVAAWSAR